MQTTNNLLGDWKEYGRLVLSELQSLHNELDNIDQTVRRIENRMVSIRVQMAVIGGAAGIFATAIANALIMLVFQ